MTREQLPDRLRKLKNLQMVSDMPDVQEIQLSEQKMRVFEVLVLPLLDRKQEA